MYKLIAIDLDDTLLNDRQEIEQENIEALLRAKKAGIRLCVMTGRNYLSTKKFLEIASFEDLTGCLNGAHIVDSVTDEFLYQYPIKGDICAEILKDIERIGTHVNLYHDHEILSRERNHITDYYRNLTGIEPKPVGMLSEYAIHINVGKLLLIDEKEELKRIKIVLEEKYRQAVYFTFSMSRHLEVNSINASKGKALKVIAEHYNIAREEIIAIGNGGNDISMLQFAGLGVAMYNSSEKVKSHANVVTLTNNENGVAHVINHYT